MWDFRLWQAAKKKIHKTHKTAPRSQFLVWISIWLLFCFCASSWSFFRSMWFIDSIGEAKFPRSPTKANNVDKQKKNLQRLAIDNMKISPVNISLSFFALQMHKKAHNTEIDDHRAMGSVKSTRKPHEFQLFPVAYVRGGRRVRHKFVEFN